jgi:hypothetical protein
MIGEKNELYFYIKLVCSMELLLPLQRLKKDARLPLSQQSLVLK